MPSPFTPSFGASPPLLVGRDEQLDAFQAALEGGVGDPGRAMLLTGPRGAGKTVTLNALEDLARRQGWEVVSETMRPGLAREMAESSLPALLGRVDPGAVTSRLTGVQGSAVGFGAGVTRHVDDRYPARPTLRNLVTTAADLLDRRGAGLLITIDEVHSAAVGDLREIAQVVQHAFREGRALAFVGAGLPSAVNDVLNDEVLTFLRRAERFTLADVDPDDVALALRQPIELAGRSIDDAALTIATVGTRGYPFLVQLVGRHMWDATPGQDRISVDDANKGVEQARRRVGRLVHEPALAGLSRVDRSFLAAMAVDAGPSRMRDIATRLDATQVYVGQYRLRLIAAELIHPAGHGRVDFSLPYLREWLREHAASQALPNT